MITDDTEHTPASGLRAEIVPLYDRLLVRVIDAGDKTSGGLVIPQMAKDNTPYLRGEVIACGHGRITPNGDTVPLSVKDGDIIVFFRLTNGGEQLVFPAPSGEELLIIREFHVALVLRNLPKATGVLGPDGREVATSGLLGADHVLQDARSHRDRALEAIRRSANAADGTFEVSRADFYRRVSFEPGAPARARNAGTAVMRLPDPGVAARGYRPRWAPLLASELANLLPPREPPAPEAR